VRSSRSHEDAVPEAGLASIAFVAAAGLSLVVFVLLVNGATVLFTHNVVRAAVDEAVRTGSRADATIAQCEARARAVLTGLLGPAVRERVTVTCRAVGDPTTIRARAAVTVVPWLPGLPELSFGFEASAVREELP
jgi:hypothetical protein